MPEDSFYKFRVANKFFGSNSSKAQAAARRAAGQVGAGISNMDDSDTSVSGISGFFLKVRLNKAVDHASFIDAFRSACGREGLSWGRSADICEDSEDWKSAHAGAQAQAKYNQVTAEAMKLQQGITNGVIDACNYISGKEQAVICISAAVEDYISMQPYTLRLKAAGYTIYQYNDTDLTRADGVAWDSQWKLQADNAWKVLVFKTDTWHTKAACQKEWDYVTSNRFGQRLKEVRDLGELDDFVSNLENKRVESWYQHQWSSRRV